MGARAKLGLANEKIFSAGQGCDTRHKAIKAKLTVDFIRKKEVLASGQNTMDVWIIELNSGVSIRAKSVELVWATFVTPFATIHNYNSRCQIIGVPRPLVSFAD